MHPNLALIGIIVRDRPRSLAFYRRVAWDTHDVIRSFDHQWQPATGGHRIGLAFLCDSPAAIIEDPDGNVIALFAANA